MLNLKLVLEYDGSGFHGWQIQPGLRTIQGELERVLQMVLRTKIERLVASGRTDAGVHARAQVVNVLFDESAVPDLDLRVLAHSVSNILRGEVSVLSIASVDLDFDARGNALSKQYSYQILPRESPAVLDKGKAWRVATALNLEGMQRAASSIIGEHDFTSFRGQGCSAKTPVRTIYESEIFAKEGMLIYRVVGQGFLKQMVRNIVGTLVGIGKNNLWTDSMVGILESRDRRKAGITAPPYGLYLDWVKY